MKNAVDTPDGKLIFDSHKLSYHYDRIEQWENGEKIAPVSVDMALTRACGAMCSLLRYGPGAPRACLNQN